MPEGRHGCPAGGGAMWSTTFCHSLCHIWHNISPQAASEHLLGVHIAVLWILHPLRIGPYSPAVCLRGSSHTSWHTVRAQHTGAASLSSTVWDGSTQLPQRLSCCRPLCNTGPGNLPELMP